jgi:drug/metabolite transporter (DMT)-like permease
MGALAALAAAFVWSVASLLFERHGRVVGGLVLNIVKCIVALVLMVPTHIALSGSLALTTIAPSGYGLLAASGLVGLAVGDSLWFACMLRMGAQRALLLYTVAPPMSAVLGHLVLGENLSPWAGVGIAITLAGVAWVIRDRTDDAEPIDAAGVLFGLGSAACQAAGTVLTKLGAPGADSLEVSIVRLLAGVVGLAVVMAATGNLRRIATVFQDRATARALFAASIFGTYLGVWFMNAGFLLTSIGVAATLNATSPIFVILLAWLVYRRRPTLRAMTGALVAVAGIALLFASGE